MIARGIVPIALLATVLVSSVGAQNDDVAEQFKALNDEYNTAYSKLVAEYRAEQDQEKKQAIVSEGLPTLTADYVGKFQEFAKENAGTGAAAEALAMICQLAPRTPETRELADKAKQALLEDYSNTAEFATVIYLFASDDDTLATLATESESRDVRGAAAFFQMEKAKGRSLTEQNVDTVKPMMEKLTSEYGDVHLLYPGGRDRGAISDLVENELFAFENLRIGKVAPDIEGEDVDGVEFKLSDYRGKVVVIDFWGDW